ncbi:hypothetical protein NE237_031112 [Protea cynaroides]|uniref:Uncharacterized protein n=1 Tax=Protea cynaroides TaxID=273540 RepID=A0A9Q0R1T7_9MAGN|nr:hypothetical protein NE237_031112 [Protea cynaroides]
MHSGDLIEREANLKQIVDIDTVIVFCIQAGQALAFDRLLAEAAASVLDEGAPLIFSLLASVAKHLPDEIPEEEEIKRLRVVANNVGMVGDHDSEWVRSILGEVGGAIDGSWSLLPYLFAAFMTSSIWNKTAFNVDLGRFNNNIHCLAREILRNPMDDLDGKSFSPNINMVDCNYLMTYSTACVIIRQSEQIKFGDSYNHLAFLRCISSVIAGSKFVRLEYKVCDAAFH